MRADSAFTFSSTPMNQILLLVAKRPAPGQTKTRLSPPLSPAGAARLYECFLRDSLELARRVQVARRIVYLPENQADYFKRLAPDFDLTPQLGDSLGERLDNALTGCLREGYDRVVIMDTDSPSLPIAYIEGAFDALNRSDVVIGPCEDGGYYLIGLKRANRRLLREVQMSTQNVLRDTLAIARQENLGVELLPLWYDIDTVADLKRFENEATAAADGLLRYSRNFFAHPK